MSPFFEQTLPAVVVTAILTALLVSGLRVVPPAHAEPRSVTCVDDFAVFDLADQRKKTIEWMNQQIAMGRTQFVQTGFGVCAW